MKITNVDLIEERKKFEKFKRYLEKIPKDQSIEDLIDKKSEEDNEKESFRTFILAEMVKEVNKNFIMNRENDYGITTEYYPHLLCEMRRLAVELKLENSLEISNLFSYLLWNGYLSKTKQNVFRSKNRKLIGGLFFADIMDGIGVCLNHADMLKDYLNECGYNSSLLINLADKKTQANYRIDIERKVEHEGKIPKLLTLPLQPIAKKFANHAFTLIEDKGNLYIYDATNLTLLKIINPYRAQIINGKGIYKLHPYFSLVFNINQDNKEAISSLFMKDDFITPYDRKDLIFTGEENIEWFKYNNSLIEDFYDEIRSDLVNISCSTDKMKVMMKKR